MKRIFSFILCAILVLTLPLTTHAACDEGALITVVIPPMPQPVPVSAPAPADIMVFPVAVFENREGNRREIIRVYELWEHESAAQIPRNSFEREGFYFELAEITRQTLPGFSTRTHVEAVTVNTQTNDLTTVMQLFSPTLEFATEDGYFGILTLDISTIQMEQAGTRTTSSTVTTVREFPHLSAPDMALVPRTVTDRNRTYQLTDVQWRQESGTNIDYRDVPTSFTAVATFSRTATSTVVTGYVTTAEYHGTVSRINSEVTRYTAYFLGVPILSPIITRPQLPVVCDDYGIVGACDCYELWTELLSAQNYAGNDKTGYADDEHGLNDYELYPNGYDAYAEDEGEADGNGNRGLIALIIILLLVIIGLVGFIHKARLIGFVTHIKASRTAAMLLVVLVATQVAITNVYAAPPPYRFGGSQHTEVHMYERNGEGNIRAQPGGFINSTPITYQYGDFLGTLHVERLNRTVRIYAGATMDAMEKGAGHFSFTGLNTGNTGLIGHNRGVRNGFFSFVRLLQYGDIITLNAGGITRSYAVALQYIVCETDFSPLMQFSDHRLTLITCVEYQPRFRRVAVLFPTH